MNKVLSTPIIMISPLNNIAKDCINALLYSEIFHYPMTAAEIRNVIISDASPIDVDRELDVLVKNGLLFRLGNYYATQDKPEWINRREEGNQRAHKHLKITFWVARFIAAFPFVKAVFISGSLSKNWIAKDGDADFFIITQPERLWFARTMLVAFKKTFLLNSHRYFCVNYFIDENHLEIEEQNQFTAMEVATLLPVYGSDYYSLFMSHNQWIKKFYPNFPLRHTTNVPKYKKAFLKPLVEWLFNGRIGEKIDRWCMQKTLFFWKKKFKTFDKETFEIALKSRQYVSKHHPTHFQQKVLQGLQQKKAAFEEQHGLTL